MILNDVPIILAPDCMASYAVKLLIYILMTDKSFFKKQQKKIPSF